MPKVQKRRDNIIKKYLERQMLFQIRGRTDTSLDWMSWPAHLEKIGSWLLLGRGASGVVLLKRFFFLKLTKLLYFYFDLLSELVRNKDLLRWN